MDFERLTGVMRRLALEGGAAIMDIYDRGELGVRQKDDASPVTEADLAADRVISAGLRSAFPEVPLVTEEQAATHTAAGDSFLIVDPLDGTKEYSQLREDWAVHVALTIDGACALGAVALPAVGQILWGVALPGHERGGIEGPGELCTGDSEAPDTQRLVVSRSHTPEWVERFGNELGQSELLPTGSAGYKTSRLLRGEADVYVHKVGLKEWDTCAPETVARALGWTVCKLRGDEHRYNQPDPKNHELVICRPAWRDRVLAAVERSGALEA